MLENKSILITGGTGSLGKALTKYLLNTCSSIRHLIIYSRDEQKQFQMAQEFPEEKYPQIRYFIGDVRDKQRLKRALNIVDYVIHAAAMKHVHIAEYNPEECIKTNVGGAQNVVQACLETNVSRVVALSTDKACAPINLYGATKLTSDKLFVAANNIKGNNPIKFSVVRYGNVMGSRGSVIPFFISQIPSGELTITDPLMTRFMITLEEGVKLVWHAFEDMKGGELYVKKIPSMKIPDIALSVAPNTKQRIIGVRPGEKIHEQMIGIEDAPHTYEYKNHYKILPSIHNWSKDPERIKDGKLVSSDFTYSSDNNPEWMSIEELSTWIASKRDKLGVI